MCVFPPRVHLSLISIDKKSFLLFHTFFWSHHGRIIRFFCINNFLQLMIIKFNIDNWPRMVYSLHVVFKNKLFIFLVSLFNGVIYIYCKIPYPFYYFLSLFRESIVLLFFDGFHIPCYF